MRRANTIISSEALRTEETSHVQDSLQVNGYPTKFIENAAQPRSDPQNHHPDPAGLAVVPYVQGISDRVKRTLQRFNIKTAFQVARSDFWVTIPFNFERLELHHHQSNRKSNVSDVLEKDESFK